MPPGRPDHQQPCARLTVCDIMNLVGYGAQDGPTELPQYRHAPLTPEQTEIKRVLKLFGPGPEVFFADACRLLNYDPPLGSVTHLVGHLLRELDGWMRDVMRPMIPPQASERAQAAASNTLAQEIEALASVLGFPPDDDIRALWKSFQHQKTAHRGSPLRPRPADGEFRAMWDNVQALLLRVGRQFESSFVDSLQRIDDLADRLNPTGDDAKRLREIPHSAVTLQRFFDRASPAWFPLLRSRHYFEAPLRVEVNEDGSVPYARWPAGQYLRRMADEARLRSDLIEVCLGLETDNPEAHESVTDVALAIPPAEGAQLAPKIAEFLATPYQWALPFKAADLVVQWAHAGETEAALQVLRPMVQAEISPDWWRATGSISKIIPNVFPHIGIAGMDLIADGLDQVLDAQIPGEPRRNDRSHIWRPTIHYSRDRDAKGSMTSALRDAAQHLARADHGGVGKVVHILERRTRAIFHRVALHVLSVVPDDGLIVERLGRRDLFDDPLIAREYDQLLREHAADDQSRIHTLLLEWIDAGPADQDQDVDAVDEWRLLQLARFGGALPSSLVQRYNSLVARFGRPDVSHPDPAPWRCTSSPRTAEDLRKLPDDDLIEFLGSWHPDEGWSGPSREGLAVQLQDAIAAEPARFVPLVDRIAATHQIYLNAVIDGLRLATDASLAFPWAPVLEPCRRIVRDAQTIPETGPENEPLYQRARVRRAVARLVDTGLSNDAIPAELYGEMFGILSELAEDPEPDVADEQRRKASGDDDPATLDLNTVRGIAFHSLMRYAWRTRTPGATGQSGFQTPLREVLDRHLDPAFEPRETIRAVYGQYFPYLIECDPEWARSKVDAIFPLDTSLTHLRLSAWNSYLIHNQAYRSAYDLLEDRYRAAVSDLAGATPGITESRYKLELRHALASHVLRIYMTSAADLSDGSLVDLFFTQAPLDLRTHLIETIGFDLLDEEAEPTTHALARLRELWTWRVTAIRQRSDAEPGELRGFGWWFASGKFDQEWALTQLHDLLSIGGTVEPEPRVLEHLAEIRAQNLPLVVSSLAHFVDLPQMIEQHWRVTHSAEHIRNILSHGIASSDDPETRQRARQVVNRLIARGHTQFGDLLA